MIRSSNTSFTMNKLLVLHIVIVIVSQASGFSFLRDLNEEITHQINYPKIVVPVQLKVDSQTQQPPVTSSTTPMTFIGRLIPQRIRFPEINVPLRFSIQAGRSNQPYVDQMQEAVN